MTTTGSTRRRTHRAFVAGAAGVAVLLSGPGWAAAADGATHDVVVAGTVRTMTHDSVAGTYTPIAPTLVIDVDGVLLNVPTAIEGGLTARQPVTVTLTAPVSMDAATATLAAGQPGGDEVVPVASVTPSGEAAPVPALNGTGSHRLIVLPVHWAGTAPDLAIVRNAVDKATAFWQTESGGRLVVTSDIRSSIAVANPLTCDPATLFDLALAAHGRRATAPGDHVLVVVPQNYSCDLDLNVAIGGTQMVTNYPTPESVAHGFGHALGLGHASTMTCTDAAGARAVLSDTCTVGVGQDRYGVMSYPDAPAFDPDHLTTAHAVALGWTTAVTPTDGQQLVTDLPLRSVLTQPRTIRLPLDDGSEVFIEYRYDDHWRRLGVALVQLVWVDGVPETRALYATSSVYYMTMAAGYAATLPRSGMTVAVLASDDDSARVSVVPDGLDAVPPTAPTITEPTGPWVEFGGTPVPVAWTAATDAGLGVVGYEVMVDGAPRDSFPADQRTGSAWFSKGPHVLVVAAVDAAGNRTLSSPVTLEAGNAPLSPTITSITADDGTLTVSWSSTPVDPAVTSFIVTAMPADVTVTVDGSARSATLTGLPNRTEQRVSVTAVNPVGTASDSERATPRPAGEWLTLTASPKVGVDVASPMTLTWEAGPALTDTVWYYRIDLNEHDIRYVGGDVRSVTMPMASNTWYDVELTAFAFDGTALTSKLLIVTTETNTGVYPDVSTSHRFYREILFLAQAGITTGYADGRFHPESSVNRDAMAAFLYRVAGGDLNGYEPPVEPIFRDVPLDHPFYKEISWLAESGITTGYADGTYRPSQPVNRDAMAAFLYRSVDAAEYYTPPDEQYFADVPRSHPFFTEIAWMADYGLTTGYPDWTFRPSIHISRDAMAAFLYRLYY